MTATGTVALTRGQDAGCEPRPALLDQIGVPALILSDRGGIVHANGPAQGLTQRLADPDCTVRDLFACASAGAIDRLIRGEVQTARLLLMRNDGPSLHVDAWVGAQPVTPHHWLWVLTPVPDVGADAPRRAHDTDARVLACAGQDPSDGVLYHGRMDSTGAMGWVWVSAGIQDVYGIRPEAAIADPSLVAACLYSDADRRILAEAQASAARHRRRFDAEYRIRATDGRVKWLRDMSVPQPGADGDALYVGVIVDITEQKTQHAKLDAIGSRMAGAFEALNEAVAIYDHTDTLVDCNEAYREVYRKCRDMVVPGVAFRTLLETAFARGVFDGHAAELGARYRIEDHYQAHTDCQDDPERLIDGRWYMINRVRTPAGDRIATLVEITAQKRIQSELALALEEAGRANRAKSNFLATMSHELRTPLNAVIGFAQMISHEILGPVGNDRYLEYLHDIENSAGHLLELIDDILDTARIESGRIVLDKRPVNPAAVVRDVMTILIPTATEKCQPVLLRDRARGASVVADRRSLRQIVMNILSNAIKYTPEGGAIDVNMAVSGQELVIQVADTGVGMTQTDITNALQPFVRLENPLVSKAGGTGLGLPLVKRLVDLHGGTLIIDSTPGKGTNVTVSLPLEG